MNVIANSEVFIRLTPETENTETTALAVRKAALPVIAGRGLRLPRGTGRFLSALSDKLNSRIHSISGFDICVPSSGRSAMLRFSSLREAVARLIDSFIVMMPLGLAAAILHQTGADNLSSTLRSAPVLTTAAFSGSIALFLAWGISYFMVSDKLLGMTPGKAIVGVWGIGASSRIYSFGRSLLSVIVNIIERLFNFRVPSLAITPSGKWPREFYLLPKTALIQREPIPLPRSIIDVT